MSSAGPRVIAVLVTRDGAGSLRRAIASVAAQSWPGIELHAVDNASEDGSAELLIELLGPDRVVLSDRDLGFPGAVAVALDAVDAADRRHGRERTDDDLVLLLHDDLELERDAVAHLVAALAEDERIAVVGPKLRWADDPSQLQSVGATIDLTGRVDDGIDPGELDQGQRDGDRRVLYVPTAGMLLRRRVLDELGGFDVRAHAFREDLDLCWRAAIAGHDVEVVPAAVGTHAALAAEHRRTGRVAELGPRYLAERNTLAALIKNYGGQRLLFVLPLAFVVGVAKVAGFLLTRRIADARATVAAWGWNLVNLPGTLRLRRRTQRMRRRSDAELAPLLGRVTPRLQAYLEAMLERVAGEPAAGEVGTAESQPSATLQGEVRGVDGDAVRPAVPALEPPVDSDDGSDGHDTDLTADPTGDLEADLAADVALGTPVDEPVTEAGPSRLRRLTAAVVARPLQTILPPSVLLLLIGLRDVLLPGPVRGGDLLPFPDGPGLLTRHLAAWHDSGATSSPLDPSPAQLVLGAVQWVGGNGALRVLFVLAPLLAWAGAMRALRPYLPGVLGRTLLALVYGFSPPVLAALATGDVVTLVVAVLAPPVVIGAHVAFDPAAPVERVWRRIALLSFLLAAAIAFAPLLVLALPLLLAAGVGHALVAVTDVRWRRTLIARSAVLAVLPLPLLGPWLLALPDVLRRELAAAAVGTGGHPIAWLTLDPSGGLLAPAGGALLVAGAAGALVVSVAAVGPTTFRATTAMLAAGVTLPLVAWWLDAAGAAARPGPLLAIAAAALVGAAAVGVSRAPEVLSAHPFGWRQVGLALVSTVTVATAAGSLVGHAVTGTPGLARAAAIPSYLASLGPHPPDRILVMGMTPDGIVWEVVPATGPDLAAFGVRHDPFVHGRITAAVDDLLAGSDPRAAARLGRLGVGIVLVPEQLSDDRLDGLLRRQSALDPLPALVGTVSRISGAVPGAAIVSGATATERVPDPTVPPRDVVAGLDRVAADRIVGTAGPGGDLVVAVPFGAGWRVTSDGAPLPMLSDDGLVRVLNVSAGAQVEVSAAADPDRTLLLRGQALWALLVVSLGARPPAYARRNARRRAEDASVSAGTGEVRG